MYNVNRMGAYFRGELDKFIKVAENYARKEKTQLIHCPCRACENLKVFSDPTTIRSHVMVSGFIKDYTIWKKYGETDAPPPTNKPLDEIIQGEEFDRMFDAYYDFDRGDDGVSVDDGVGDSIVMMSMTGPSTVIVVNMNLMTEIFGASSCATPK